MEPFVLMLILQIEAYGSTVKCRVNHQLLPLEGGGSGGARLFSVEHPSCAKMPVEMRANYCVLKPGENKFELEYTHQGKDPLTMEMKEAQDSPSAVSVHISKTPSGTIEGTFYLPEALSHSDRAFRFSDGGSR